MAPRNKKKLKGTRGGKGGRAKLEEDEVAEDCLRQQSEELTVMRAIYQEDFRQISDNPSIEYSISVRPHSVDNSSGEDGVSADLIIRYVPGYPHKPPKLHVDSAKGLSDADVVKLQEMLVEQAGALAREGRVMVFNLAETTQEFLSEHKTGHESLWDQMQDRLASVDTAENSRKDAEEESDTSGAWQNRIGSVDFNDWLGDGEDEWDYRRMPQFSLHVGPSDKRKGKALLSGKGRKLSSEDVRKTSSEEPRKSSFEEREPLSPLPPQAGQVQRKDEVKGARGEAEAAATRRQRDDIGSVVVPEGSESEGKDSGRAGWLVEVGGMAEAMEEPDEPELSGDVAEEEDDEESGQSLTKSGRKPPKSTMTSTFLGNLFRGMSRIRPSYSGRKSGQRSKENSEDEVEEVPEAPGVPGTSGVPGTLGVTGTWGVPGVPGSRSITECRRDFLLAQLLRVSCTSRGPLPNTFSIVGSQMLQMGVLPEYVYKMVTTPKMFDSNFRRLFAKAWKDPGDDTEPSLRWTVSNFWMASEQLYVETTSEETSRYVNDFKEEKLLGKGGFGSVKLCVNKLDGRRYAVKKIVVKDSNKTQLVNSKILREVATLSRLQHHHVVRYYQAWFETGKQYMGAIDERSESDDEEGAWRTRGEGQSSSVSGKSGTPKSDPSQTTCLYIQMEYCPMSLRQLFDSMGIKKETKDTIWRIFRQIVEGLQHIHLQGVVHRDLTPSNIFFSPLNDIKIGDFGLAKFTNLDGGEKDGVVTGAASMASAKGASIEGTSEVGTLYYTAPEIEQGWSHIDEKVDMYSLGIVCFELWHPFSTAMERYMVLNELKHNGVLPKGWETECPQQAALVKWLIAPNPSDRPSAAEVLRSELLPPRMEDESLNDILRTILSGEDSSVYERVLGAIFSEDRITVRPGDPEAAKSDLLVGSHSSNLLVGPRDKTVRAVRTVFRRHGAQPTECSFTDFGDVPNKIKSCNAVKLVDSSGNLLEMRYGLRVPLAEWLANNQITSLKRYEISRVYRRGTGRSVPHEYFQGDFDIIGGGRTLADAEAIKVAVEVVREFPAYSGCEVRLNHRDLLNAVWSFIGIPRDERSNIAKVMWEMCRLPPKSTARKAEWNSVRKQLQRGLGMSDAVIDRLQNVERRLNGEADGVLHRLRGALPNSLLTTSALEEISTLLGYLRTWGIGQDVTVDALMDPDEDYYSGLFFQVHLKCSNKGREGTLPVGSFAVGGRYDDLVRHFWNPQQRGNAPKAVGLSIGLAKLIKAANYTSRGGSEAEVLVCSKGGGGLLQNRMEIVAEFWENNIKADFLSLPAPSLKEQYEYANEQCIKWLVIITQEALSRNDAVKVRNLDLKMEEDVARGDLVKFFTVGLNTPLSQRRKAALQRSHRID